MSFNGVHLLAPGEVYRPLPKPPAAPNPPDLERKDPATHCAGCGAVLQLGRWTCAWCTLPYPNAPRGGMEAIEVTSLVDVVPRYWPGWEPPRPLPPASRVVRECETNTDLPEVRTVIEDWRLRHSKSPSDRCWLYGFLLPLACFAIVLGVWVAKQ